MLFLATLVLNGSAYVYNVACIRYLGSRGYSDVYALLTLTALVALPLGSVQSLLAREVAQIGTPEQIARLLRRSSAIAAAIGFALLVIGIALIEQIKSSLSIASGWSVVAGLTFLVPAVVVAILYGFLQGALRFSALSKTYALSGLGRPILVVPALLLGLGATGALAVNTVAASLAVLLAAYALKDVWSLRPSDDVVRLDRRQMIVLLVGSLAFASLTNVDVLLANYYFPDDVAGVYSAASFVGKAVLFLPAAVVTVLLPKAASRAAAGLTASKILFASAAVTAVVTLALTGLLALVPESLMVWAFGGDFRESTELLGWFGLAMSAAAIVNVYLSVYFAERDAKFPMLVGAAAVVQIVAIALWHPDPRSIVLVTLACASGIMVVHEIAFPYSLARTWRAIRMHPGQSG